MIASFPPVIIYLCVWAQSSLNAFLGVLLSLLLIVFGLLISVFVRKHNKKSRKRYLSKSIRHLLVHGRKSIATITAIEYQSIADAELQDCSNSTEGNLYYYNGLPNFVVSYKFNPPDDASAEDIVHCIVIHTSPEGRIKVGEPLPILYEIDSRDAEIVTSMPVPFAMSDIADMREIICRTKGRARCVLKK